ncbi:hypothetical protein [Nocardia sp. CA-119907]|uniref:hypothetical protein n=1 Tax=Nocardia sp. CA-119907 TaxID=3239973 RepID=UPI003D97B8EC
MARPITMRPWNAALSATLLQPPSWTRLEPQSLSGDPGPGLAAPVHDPLWLLTRQWQFGEFVGEDAGTPLSVQIEATAAPITRWRPGDWTAPEPQAAQDFPANVSLEQLVTRESSARPPGLRLRAEAGAALLAALREADLHTAAAAVLRETPLIETPPPGSRWSAPALVLAGRAVDAERVRAACESAGPGALPAWLDGPDRAEIAMVLSRWLDWYHGEMAPPIEADSWVGPRLEHRFSIGVAESDGSLTLRAAEVGSGELDWWSFDLGPDGPATGPDAPEHLTHRALATPLRYAGMPADRFWEFEDARVDFGALESQPHDLARLLVAECALIYGCDWLVLPLDVPTGSVVTIESVTYRTTFGETYLAGRHVDRPVPTEPWRMFTLTAEPAAWENRQTTSDARSALVVPPAVVGRLEGPAVEEVAFLRDEVTNLVWAVERIVEDRAGEPFTRDTRQHGTQDDPVDRVPDAELDYLLQTSIPETWIPYLPRIAGSVGKPVRLELRRGALRRFGHDDPPSGTPVVGLGRLLTGPEHAVLEDAEVPREGIVVRRIPTMARLRDGSYALWTARRIAVGRGEGHSGLAFDSTLPRHPA